MKVDADQVDGYYVYLLRCSDGSFYCGITKDIERRMREHNDGAGAKYTRGRGPVELLAFTARLSKPDALRFERKVKSVKKSAKLLCFTLEPPLSIV